MKKKESTVKNITKELKKFLRERGCLRVFKKAIRQSRQFKSVYNLIKLHVETHKTCDSFNIDNMAYVSYWFMEYEYDVLYVHLREWEDYYNKTFNHDN